MISSYCRAFKRSRFRGRLYSWAALFLFCAVALAGLPRAEAQMVRTQRIDLNQGWNAVYLELDPSESDPAALFAGLPVDVVALYVMPSRGAQFVGNPGAGLLGAYGWLVWYSPARSDAFLTTLRGVYGAKPYLIHATSNVTLEISGPTALSALKWTPNAYNFVGFSVVSPGAPTFRQFFSGSPAHNHNKIYRLVDNTWRQVLDPSARAMRSGEAFWIYCDGRSDYPGPLEVGTRSHLGVTLSSQAGSDVVFKNRTDHPVSFHIEHLTDPAQPIPISTPVMALDEASGGLRTISVHFDAEHFEQDFPSLEAGKAIRLPLELRLQDAGPGLRQSLLKVVTDVGSVAYIPITATRDDL